MARGARGHVAARLTAIKSRGGPPRQTAEWARTAKGLRGLSMTRTAKLLGASLIIALAASASSAALAQAAQPQDPRDARIDQLESEVATLAAEVQDLKRQQALQVQTVPAPAARNGAPAAVATIANGHPSIASPDGRFTVNLHGILQFDAAAYDQAPPGPLASDF